MGYCFFYWRQSPRGNVKFGITHLPWERLRMFQQGTDEEIQFDHLWLLRSADHWELEDTEKELKNYYRESCLHNDTQRTGHSEWFKQLDFESFENNIHRVTAKRRVEIKKIKLKSPYTATKSSLCPFNSPSNSRHQDKRHIYEWTERFWNSIPTK
jgi:hypothetical protein